jgi:hypothetical protein
LVPLRVVLRVVLAFALRDVLAWEDVGYALELMRRLLRRGFSTRLAACLVMVALVSPAFGRCDCSAATPRGAKARGCAAPCCEPPAQAAVTAAQTGCRDGCGEMSRPSAVVELVAATGLASGWTVPAPAVLSPDVLAGVSVTRTDETPPACLLSSHSHAILRA